jgi:hypothetical protein
MNEKIKNELPVVKDKHKVLYTTTEIMELTGISLRTLRYRISELRKKYKDGNTLLYKKDRHWVIDSHLAYYFFPRTHKRKEPETLYDIDWKSFITWIPSGKYDKDYHSQLIKEAIELYPSGVFLPVIEETLNGINHVHMISDLDVSTLGKKIEKMLGEYWHFWEYRLEMEPILDKGSVINYLLKNEMDVKSIGKNKNIINQILKKYTK